MLRAAALAALLVGAQVAPAAADDPPATPDYFAQRRDPDKVTLRHGRARTGEQKVLIAGLAGGAALTAGVGIYFHLDSRRIANDLSQDRPGDFRWSPALQDRYDRGQLDGKLAIASYVISVGLIAGTIVAVLMTDPGSDLIEVPTHQVTPTASVVPGGGTVGAAWSW